MKYDSSRVIINKILDHTELNKKMILEIGCGNGRITQEIACFAHHAVGIDPNFEKVNHAKANNANIDFLLGRGEELSFEDESFDCLIYTLSLHHHQDPVAALMEAKRVVKNSGKIVIIEPCADGEVEKLFDIFHNEYDSKIFAQKAIDDSCLKIMSSEYFAATWIFDDADEICDYLSDYFKIFPDINIKYQVIDCLKDKSSNKPIVLEDRMIIHTLLR